LATQQNVLATRHEAEHLLLKATTHWAQDFGRISRAATLEGINDAAKFQTRIEMTRQRA
jgi:hypothetical protein